MRIFSIIFKININKKEAFTSKMMNMLYNICNCSNYSDEKEKKQKAKAKEKEKRVSRQY